MAHASFLCLVLVLVWSTYCEAVRFEVTAYSKCLGEEIQAGVLVVGDYAVVGAAEQQEGALERITVKVTSPYGQQLHWQEGVEKGQFGFTTKEAGQYMACFWIPHATPGVHKLQVELDWKTGVAAKDWASIAKKDKLDDMTLELRKLEEAVQSIRDEMMYFRTREAEMRDLNEVANTRVASLSVVSLLICISLAALQLGYLKSYFERKKLL
eukprot:TRINITY_DN19070_c0_g1_i1.p1 TRINITY_DN19070_c0_g1~~TRINITY_DN19070_c0_g1_i1.p1  ORF type:complete len:211 (-),score=56.45 TRINITY_DN19070_c0_g1_i1:466-1098(-)